MERRGGTVLSNLRWKGLATGSREEKETFSNCLLSSSPEKKKKRKFQQKKNGMPRLRDVFSGSLPTDARRGRSVVPDPSTQVS